MAKDAFNKRRAIDAKNGQKIKKENYESSCVECSVIWLGNVDNEER